MKKNKLLLLLITSMLFNCKYQKVTLVNIPHDKIVKYEGQSADFYLDSDMVKKWVKDWPETNYPNIIMNGTEKDKALFLELENAKKGDTIIINELNDCLIIESIIEENFKEIFMGKSSVEIRIFDKKNNEFVERTEAGIFKSTFTHGAVGKRFILFNAGRNHDKFNGLFLYYFDIHGGFR